MILLIVLMNDNHDWDKTIMMIMMKMTMLTMMMMILLLLKSLVITLFVQLSTRLQVVDETQ